MPRLAPRRRPTTRSAGSRRSGPRAQPSSSIPWHGWRDTLAAFSFYALWSTPFAKWAGQRHAFERTRLDPEEIRALPLVERAIERRSGGGYPAAVARMLVMVADARGAVRRDRLERADTILETTAPVAFLGAKALAALIRDQTLPVEFDPAAALASLPDLLPTCAKRERALQTLCHVAGGDNLDSKVAAVLRDPSRSGRPGDAHGRLGQPAQGRGREP
ncbi:MAG: hypothetical protein ACK4MT_00270 [Thermaurantiacus tibetensis]|uniref:hypothetical protein n=1 Tax=Thermaurantiacus tibetensis TaxID=2759035 RepID=UPI001F41E3B9|nr:hypothetical protein [Thermaurantiacus tibetensis]